MKTKLHLRNNLTAFAALLAMMLIMPDQTLAQTKYGLWVTGKRVTSDNCNDLTCLEGVSGKVSFSPETNTLKLSDATITYGATVLGIENDIPLTIELEGNNKITGSNAIASMGADTKICGSGSVEMTVDYDDAIYLKRSASLTIEDCTMSVKGKNYGLLPIKEGSTLIVRNVATLSFEGAEAAIADIDGLVLEGSSILTPAGAAFNKNLRGVAKGGKLVSGKVVFDSAAGIDAVGADAVSAAKPGIYNLQGTRLQQSWESLPKGIYIMDGVKKVKK